MAHDEQVLRRAVANGLDEYLGDMNGLYLSYLGVGGEKLADGDITSRTQQDELVDIIVAFLRSKGHVS